MDRNPQAASDRFDDDGRLKRIACYRSDDPLFGERNYTYMDVVHSNLGGWKARLCGLVQYSSLFGLASGYTIAASTSMVAIKRSNCFHENGDDNPCHVSSKIYMIMFGAFEIVFSQIPDFDQIWWLSIVAAIMSFTYSLIGLALAVAKIAVTRKFKGSLTGISKEAIAEPQKIWRCFQALGIIAFPYSYSVIQIEIQRIPRWSWRWFSLQMLSIGCLAVATVAAAGWVARIVFDRS